MGLAKSGEQRGGECALSCGGPVNCVAKTLVPGTLALGFGSVEIALWASDRGMAVFSPAPELALEGERGSSAVRDVVAEDELLKTSEGRRCELDDESDGGWNRMVSKPGFFFFLPSQLSRML